MKLNFLSWIWLLLSMILSHCLCLKYLNFTPLISLLLSKVLSFDVVRLKFWNPHGIPCNPQVARGGSGAPSADTGAQAPKKTCSKQKYLLAAEQKLFAIHRKHVFESLVLLNIAWYYFGLFLLLIQYLIHLFSYLFSSVLVYVVYCGGLFVGGIFFLLALPLMVGGI